MPQGAARWWRGANGCAAAPSIPRSRPSRFLDGDGGAAPLQDATTADRGGGRTAGGTRRCCPTSGSRSPGLPILICSRRARPGVRRVGGTCCGHSDLVGAWSPSHGYGMPRADPRPGGRQLTADPTHGRRVDRRRRRGGGLRSALVAWHRERIGGRQMRRPGPLRQHSPGTTPPSPPTESASSPTTPATSGSGTPTTRTSGAGPTRHSGDAATPNRALSRSKVRGL